MTARQAYHTRDASLSAPKTIPNRLSDELPETSNKMEGITMAQC